MTNNEMEDIKREFLEEASFMLEDCEKSFLSLETSENKLAEIQQIFRVAHSFKGAGAAVGFADIAAFAHTIEDLLSMLKVFPAAINSRVITCLLKAGDAFKDRVEKLKNNDSAPWLVDDLRTEARELIRLCQEGNGVMPASAPPPAAVAKAAVESAHVGKGPVSAVKVDSERIDKVLNLIGELVVIKSQLLDQVGMHPSDTRLNDVTAILDKNIRELQDEALFMRMTSLKTLFLKTQRAVRDLSNKLGKRIDFVTAGEDTEIDRTMVDLLGDPILHLVRNALDHGIEPTELRKQRGKPEQGRIRLSGRQRGSRIEILIEDDGGGLPKEKILKKALERGLITAEAAAKMPEREIFALVFLPGLSTAEAVTDVSGRGVGMDVVKTNIDKMKGHIEISSREGLGTQIVVNLPLTMAISEGLVVKAGGEMFILPMDCVEEMIHLQARSVFDGVKGGQLLSVRGEALPLIDIKNFFDAGPRNDGGRVVAVLVRAGERRAGFLIDEVLGQAQIVLKPLHQQFVGIRGLSGSAILGNGSVTLVIDPQEIVRAHMVGSLMKKEACA